MNKETTDATSARELIQLDASGRPLAPIGVDEAGHRASQAIARSLAALVARHASRMDYFLKMRRSLREILWHLVGTFPMHSSFPVSTAPIARIMGRSEQTIRKAVRELLEVHLLEPCYLSTKTSVLIFTDAGPRLTQQPIYRYSDQFIKIIDKLSAQDLFIERTSEVAVATRKGKSSPSNCTTNCRTNLPDFPKKAISIYKKEIRTKRNEQTVFTKAGPAAGMRTEEGEERSFDTGTKYKTRVENGLTHFVSSNGKQLHLSADLVPLVNDFAIDPAKVIALMDQLNSAPTGLTLQTLITVFVTTKAALDPRTRGLRAASYLRKMIENDASENRLVEKANRIETDRQEKITAAAKKDRASAYPIGQVFSRIDGARWWIDRPGFMHSNLTNAEHPLDLEFFAAIDEHTIFAYGLKTENDVPGTYLTRTGCTGVDRPVAMDDRSSPVDMPRAAVPEFLMNFKKKLLSDRGRARNLTQSISVPCLAAVPRHETRATVPALMGEFSK